MVNRDFKKTRIHFIVNSVDSEEATLLETLENDIEDFFFGVKVVIETEESHQKRKDPALKTIKYQMNN